MQTLKIGDFGYLVIYLQNRLQELGFNPGPADGKLGTQTAEALKQFQSRQGLLANGIADVQTLAALFPVPPAPSLLSDKAILLIIEFEVGGGQKSYNVHPIWPEAQSGITIGIGYDLGYNSPAGFNQDWHQLGQLERNQLTPCCGLKGQAAKTYLSNVQTLVIPWNLAWNVFVSSTIPKFYQLTKSTFPGFEQLPSNAQGALVSLVFNRGSDLDENRSSPDDRRREMRAIRDLVPRKDLAGIAQQLRQMKRIWVGTSVEKGLAKRREAEAILVEQP